MTIPPIRRPAIRCIDVLVSTLLLAAVAPAQAEPPAAGEREQAASSVPASASGAGSSAPRMDRPGAPWGVGYEQRRAQRPGPEFGSPRSWGESMYPGQGAMGGGPGAGRGRGR